MKTTVNITATGISIEMDDMLVRIESKSSSMQKVENLFEDIHKMDNGSETKKPKATHGGFRVFSAKPRSCIKCGNQFIPIGQGQQYCSEACGMKRKSQKEKTLSKLKNKKLDLAEEAALQKTLAEIEANNKKPYKVAE